MILDLTLEENTYFLKIHQKFFQNKTRPLISFQNDKILSPIYSDLGIYHISGKSFGVDGCFKFLKDEDAYLIYYFDFPKNNQGPALRKILLSMCLASSFVADVMYDHKEYYLENYWNDQSISIYFQSPTLKINDYSIGGRLYPWFKKNLFLLNEKELLSINNYVQSEIKRISNFFYNSPFSWSGHVTITKRSFYIQTDVCGQWFSWCQQHQNDIPDNYMSFNMHYHSDQELCFGALAAMNTWLRKNIK